MPTESSCSRVCKTCIVAAVLNTNWGTRQAVHVSCHAICLPARVTYGLGHVVLVCLSGVADGAHHREAGRAVMAVLVAGKSLHYAFRPCMYAHCPSATTQLVMHNGRAKAKRCWTWTRQQMTVTFDTSQQDVSQKAYNLLTRSSLSAEWQMAHRAIAVPRRQQGRAAGRRRAVEAQAARCSPVCTWSTCIVYTNMTSIRIERTA